MFLDLYLLLFPPAPQPKGNTYCIMTHELVILDPKYEVDFGFRVDCSNYIFAANNEDFIQLKERWHGKSRN